MKIPESFVFDAVVRPPGSKSLTNRALLIAALADGQTVLDGALDSEDTRIMYSALETLGLDVNFDTQNQRITISGCGGVFPNRKAEIFVGNSGTTARFLTAALAIAPGEKNYRITGKPRMYQRPISDLTDALKQLGANIRTESPNGCPPVVIGTSEYDQADWNTPGSQGRPIVTSVSGAISSQFLSALMMSAPLISSKNDVVLKITGSLVSVPYVKMTGQIMDSFGVKIDYYDQSLEPQDSFYISTDMKANNTAATFTIPQGSAYVFRQYAIEPDASAASYFFAAAAVRGGKITVLGLSKGALQGDVAFVECLEKMGCKVDYADDSITVHRDPTKPLHGIEVDMNGFSDTVQTLAVVAFFANSPTRITNVAHIRHKETDRIAAVAAELRKIGAIVDEFEDGLEIFPPAERIFAKIETYDDHRMAMSFSLASLHEPGVEILNPKCVEKTYPNFFEDMQKLIE